MDDFDTDKDGALSLEEAIAANARANEESGKNEYAGRAGTIEGFNRTDTNNDGYMTPNEIRGGTDEEDFVPYEIPEEETVAEDDDEDYDEDR